MLLSTRVTDYNVLFLKGKHVNVASCSITGRVRIANEDSCDLMLDSVNGDLFVVCDGMGGHVGGAVASNIAVDNIIRYMSTKKYTDIAGAMRAALQVANLAVLNKTVDDPSLKGMGTTACILLVQDSMVWIGHMGDSRIYLYKSDSKTLHRVTKDHSYVQRCVDLGELDERDAENNRNKNIILKALGVKPSLTFDEGDVVEHPINPVRGDVFLICSDGLSSMLDDDQIEAVLREKGDIEQKVQTLLKEANAEGKGTDNITVQLVEILDSNVANGEGYFVDYSPSWRRNSMDIYGAHRTLEFPVSNKKKPMIWLWMLLTAVITMVLTMVILVGILKLQMKKDTTEKNSIEYVIDSKSNPSKDERPQLEPIEQQLDSNVQSENKAKLDSKIQKEQKKDKQSNLLVALKNIKVVLSSKKHKSQSEDDSLRNVTQLDSTKQKGTRMNSSDVEKGTEHKEQGERENKHNTKQETPQIYKWLRSISSDQSSRN